MRTKLTFTLFAVLFYLSAAADTFIVTSNADSGPGTLRDAITLANANGTAVMDYIHFNIAGQSVADRTIGLNSELPYLSSNITIDGTTQPGAKIGVSDAKIRITNPTGIIIEQVFVVMDANNVSIYGIHFHSLNFIYDPNNGTAYAAAIRLHNATNVAIGAIGKGNYFTKLVYAVCDVILPYSSRGFSTNISFKSNIVNLSEDGNTVDDCCTRALSLTNVKNFEIGGDDPQEGNFINGGYNESTVTVLTDSSRSVNTGFLKIINNKFGCNYTQTAPLISGSVSLVNAAYYGSVDTCQVIVKNNSYNFVPPGMSFDMYGFLSIRDKAGFIDIKGNKIMLLSSSTVYFTDIVNAFTISGCEDGIIGGPGPDDANYLVASNRSGIALYNNKNITITKNSIWCNDKGITSVSDKVIVPKTKIFTLTDYTAAGTASVPNCTVEVFLNKSPCKDCNNGKTYLGSVMADAQGNWSFTSAVLLDGPVTATATTPDGATGEFAHPEYDEMGMVSYSPTCHQNNGYIHGIKFVAGTRYYWLYYSQGTQDTIFSQDVDNAAPGVYVFVVEQGKYCSVKSYVSLEDASPKINSVYKTLTNPTCGLFNGSITDISVTGIFNKVIWQDAGGNEVGNSSDLFNAGEGQYRLIVSDTIYGCGDTSEIFTLTNLSGPTLHTANVKIIPATCGNNNGSITGLTVSNVNGTPVIQWYDSLNNIAGDNYDLQNVPAGKYHFVYKDAGGCDTIRSRYYAVADKGSINIDTAGMLVTASKCSSVSGSIQHVNISGGDTYQWLNTSSATTAGSLADVFNLAAGNYQLMVTNTYGCSKMSPVITVPQSSFSPVTVTNVVVSNALCSQNNGSVTINGFSTATGDYTFRWTDSVSGQDISHATSMTGLAPGTYRLFATDPNGCEQEIYKAVITAIPPPVIDYSQSVVTDDECKLMQGGVSLKINGLTGPTSYTWYDKNGRVAGSGSSLQNVSAGAYTVTVTDATVCTIQSEPFLVGNVNHDLAPPAYNDVTVARNANATIDNKNAPGGEYHLYTTPGATVAAFENNTGNFIIPSVSQDTTVYILRTMGSCSSNRVAVHITVIDKASFTIPTAFTPNRDGLNDRLTVRATGVLALDYFRIYNQWGELVFETHRLGDGWDGTIKGVLQNTGSFVWIAQGKDITGSVLVSKGTFVLIR